MKKIKILMLFIIIIIVIIIGLLFFYSNSNNKQENNNIEIADNNSTNTENIARSDIKMEPTDTNTIEYVVKYEEDSSTYFTIQALAENYIIAFMSEDKNELKSVLSSSYIKQNNINDNNILKIAQIPKSERLMYKILTMNMKKMIISRNNLAYIINGKGITIDSNKKFSYNFMISVNDTEKKYSIYPEKYVIDKNLNNLKIGDKVNTKEFKNLDAVRKYSNITVKNDAEIARTYLKKYFDLLQYDKEEAYNKLENDYRKKRFGSKESFYNYLEDNKIAIALIELNKYTVINRNGYIYYICIDKYNNSYIFKQEINAIMNYTVFLDNYTIMDNIELASYSTKGSTEKASYNLNKINQMLNTKDYNAIYSHLDDNFKANNFKTVNDLKTYIKKNFYDINDIKITEYTEQDNCYAFKCKLSNQRNTKESKNISIIVSKTNTTDFTVSFSFE